MELEEEEGMARVAVGNYVLQIIGWEEFLRFELELSKLFCLLMSFGFIEWMLWRESLSMMLPEPNVVL